MKKPIIILIACTTLLITVAGCKKYLDVNDNPNLSVNAPLNGLLSSTTFNTGYNVFNTGNYAAYWVQYLASPNQGSSGDIYEEVDYSEVWHEAGSDGRTARGLYNTMADLYDMIKVADSLNAPQYGGVGKIMMALNLHLTIDFWGSVPFKEALRGDSLQPHYDPEPELFDSCMALLDAGIALLERTDATVVMDGKRDLLYGGSTDAWKKMAYALKARLLNHLTKKPDYDPAQVLDALGKAFAGNGDDAQLTQFQGLSFWNQVAVNNENQLLDGWLSQQLVDALNGKTFGISDPRLPLITDVTKFGDYRGTPNGKGRIGTGTNKEECYLINSASKFYSRPGAPLLIITFAECKFIQAEASFRAGNKGNAYTAYLAGIRAHMDKMGVRAADRDNYLNNPEVAVGANSITLDLIMKEKYVAMFLNPEAWADARRFDYKYKDFALPVNAALNTFIRRVAYPSTEKNRNGSNVPQVTLADKLWWDQ